MKETRLLLGMPITVEVEDTGVSQADIQKIYDYFQYIDEKYSPFKETSELSRLNRGESEELSDEMKQILKLCEETKEITSGYFNINKGNKINTSGLVKGWAINNAAKILEELGFENFYVDAGGDIQTHGKVWRVGIRNPFNRFENVKILKIQNQGVATSGTYIRGQHIYDPFNYKKEITEICSLTVVGPNIYEADRMATAAFAMGKKGIVFIEGCPQLEGYMIDALGTASYTSGFNNYTA